MANRISLSTLTELLITLGAGVSLLLFAVWALYVGTARWDLLVGVVLIPAPFGLALHMNRNYAMVRWAQLALCAWVGILLLSSAWFYALACFPPKPVGGMFFGITSLVQLPATIVFWILLGFAQRMVD